MTRRTVALRSLVLCASAVLTLAGCAGAAVQARHDYTARPVTSIDFSYIADDQDLPLIVYGDPFDGRLPDDVLARDLGALIQQGTILRPRTISPDVEAPARDRYTVRAVFDAPVALDDRAVCRVEAVRQRDSDPDLTTLTLAICERGESLFVSEGRLRGLTGPEDPRYDDLVRQTARTLTPSPFDPRYRNRRNDHRLLPAFGAFGIITSFGAVTLSN